MDERRRIQNALVNPKSQLSLAIPFLLVVMYASALVAFVFFQFSNAINLNIAGMSAETLELLSQAQERLFLQMSLGIILLFIATIVYWAFVSHRIFGPFVQIEKQVDNFLAGRYSDKIQLRQHDEFKGLATKLNELGTQLERKG